MGPIRTHRRIVGIQKRHGWTPPSPVTPVVTVAYLLGAYRCACEQGGRGALGSAGVRAVEGSVHTQGRGQAGGSGGQSIFGPNPRRLTVEPAGEPRESRERGAPRFRLRRTAWLSGSIGTPRLWDHRRDRSGVASRGLCSRLPADRPG